MALWTPAQLSSELWIDFSDTSTLFDATSGGSNVTNGVGIARAEDKSGNARHFTQGTAGARPTWTSGVQNSLGIARYDGGDTLANTTKADWVFLHSSKATIILVVKNGTSANPVAAYGWVGTGGNSSANIGVNFSYDDRGSITGQTDAFLTSCTRGVSGSTAYISLDTPGTSFITDFRNVITPNTFSIASIKSDPVNVALANRIKLAVNGGNLVGNNERTAAVTTSNPTFDIQIGAVGNNQLPLVGDYCELLIFDSLLSDTDRQLVEGYLAWKWGLEGNLPAGHPYENAAPTTGIARPRINGGLLNNGLINRGLIR